MKIDFQFPPFRVGAKKLKIALFSIGTKGKQIDFYISDKNLNKSNKISGKSRIK